MYFRECTPQLKALCEVLGTTDITPQVDSFDYEILMEYAKEGCFVDVNWYDPDWPEFYGTCLVKGTKDSPGERICVASLECMAEGPFWKMPLDFLKIVLEHEVSTIRQHGDYRMSEQTDDWESDRITTAKTVYKCYHLVDASKPDCENNRIYDNEEFDFFMDAYERSSQLNDMAKKS